MSDQTIKSPDLLLDNYSIHHFHIEYFIYYYTFYLIFISFGNHYPLISQFMLNQDKIFLVED